jgi:hypothetical protein
MRDDTGRRSDHSRGPIRTSAVRDLAETGPIRSLLGYAVMPPSPSVYLPRGTVTTERVPLKRSSTVT